MYAPDGWLACPGPAQVLARHVAVSAPQAAEASEEAAEASEAASAEAAGGCSSVCGLPWLRRE